MRNERNRGEQKDEEGKVPFLCTTQRVLSERKKTVANFLLQVDLLCRSEEFLLFFCQLSRKRKKSFHLNEKLFFRRRRILPE